MLQTPGDARNVPASHRSHRAGDVSFAGTSRSPGGHDEAHTVDPGAAKRPGAHATHVDAADAPTTVECVCSAHRRQLVSDPAPRVGENRPGGQLEQADAPAPAKVPGRHCWHAEAFVAPSNPDAEPNGHEVHAAIELAPTTAEYDPEGHGSQTSAVVAPRLVE